jgi:hypothetical protein
VALAAVVAGFLLWPRISPGTVAEQRSRLPPPAECVDPVAGVWRSHSYDAPYTEWLQFTLEVRRVEGSETELTGEITNHFWYGGPEDSEPTPCYGDIHAVVHMEARGSFDPETAWVEFGGTEWELEELRCGYLYGYNLDNFSGRIDYDLQEFQSVNNDGGRSVNDPTVFRRIDCFDDENDEPAVTVQPPPLFPSGDRSGGCWL